MCPLIVLPFARIGTVVSSPCNRSAARTWVSISACNGCSAAVQAIYLVGQRRYAEVNAFAAVSPALPVQRPVLAKLLEQNHRQQIRSGEATRRRYGTAPAVARIISHRRTPGELRAPSGSPSRTWNDLQRFGNVLAKL